MDPLFSSPCSFPAYAPGPVTGSTSKHGEGVRHAHSCLRGGVWSIEVQTNITRFVRAAGIVQQGVSLVECVVAFGNHVRQDGPTAEAQWLSTLAIEVVRPVRLLLMGTTLRS